MKLATIEDFDAIKDAFAKNRDMFPHIRADYLHNMILKRQCVYLDDIIITFNFYKRNNSIGDIVAPKGSGTLKQILNTNKGNGNAGKVLDSFLCWAERDIYLSVRENNTRAISFYKKHNFDLVGLISWKQGTLPGHVYRWKYTHAELPVA